MKKLVLLPLILGAILAQMHAQSLTSNELIGKWTIVEVVSSMENVPAEYQQRMETVKERFKNSKFEFSVEQRFSFDTSLPELKAMKGYWNYDDKTGSYLIQDWSDRGTNEDILMWIYAKRDGDKTLFQLNETPLVFEVVKSK